MSDRRLLPALALAGCLQGGVAQLDGTWRSGAGVDRCYVAVTFGPGDAYASDRICEGANEPSGGTYTAEGDILHVVDETGAYDVRWWFEPHADRLRLAWSGHVLLLTRAQ